MRGWKPGEYPLIVATLLAAAFLTKFVIPTSTLRPISPYLQFLIPTGLTILMLGLFYRRS